MKKGRKMKSLTIVLALSLVLCASAYAQMGGGMMEGREGKMEPRGMMPESMMQMCMPMMKQMMGQGMMMKDMMQMMMDMMDMQKKMIKGMNPTEKKEMMTNMDKMMDSMQKMMSMHMGMMVGTGEPRENLKCAGEWLKKAIDLHEVHIKDPKTATEASQMEMMDQMKHAYECITGAVMEKEKAREEKPSKDPHGH
jgi:hypothetical protein